MWSRTLWRHQERSQNLRLWHKWLDDWKKLQLIADKTGTMLFNSSKLKHPPEPLSICQATISFPDSFRNLGFYLDKDLSMKEHINSSTKLLSWKSDALVLFATTSPMMPPKLLLFLSYSHALTIATLSWLVSPTPWSANFRESKTVQPVLYLHTFTSPQYSNIFTGCL